MDFSMRKNGIRLLLLLAVVIGAAAVVQDLHFDNTLASTRASVYGVDGELGALNVKVSDFRAAQAGYLAAGQDPVSWMRHASAMADEITATFGRIRSSSIAPDASIRLEAAAAAFAALADADTRARKALAEGHPAAAGEAIFSESLAHRERLASELSAARSAHVSAIERDMSRLGQIRLGLTAAAISLVLLLTLLASRLNRQPPVSAAASMAQMLRELPPPVKSPLATPSVPIAVPAKPAAATATAPTAVTPATVNLPEAAELCGDLAQVIDGSDVPGLLARTARLLEASGVIVWMADTDGRRLQPALTHGYSDKVLSRLGSLAVDADNVTSLAFRSRRSQQVNGGSSGAIAIPLVTANGCTGVLAAEVKDTKLAPDAIALARIIAAQFATIIAPVDESLQARAAEA